MSAPRGPQPSPAPSHRRSPTRVALAALVVTAMLTGCATRSVNVAAEPVTDAHEFATWDCTQLQNELDRVQRRAADVAWEVDERAGNNIVALGVGVMVFWPAVMAMQRDGLPAAELARLKGRDEALRATMRDDACPPPAADMAPATAAQMPVAVGDRLVYIDRPFPRHPGKETAVQVKALRRDEIEFVAVPPPGADPASVPHWRQDLAGNVSGPIPDGLLHWRRLLRPEMALGQVVAGDLLVGGDPELRGRVRGQVVAVGPQTVAGHRFDVAVLELFGDVVRLDSATRLDGVMAVDRRSGVLIRLDLGTADSQLALRRELSRIESPQ